jgi:hypothetical protein
VLPPVRQLGGRQLLAAEARRGELPLGAALALGRGTARLSAMRVVSSERPSDPRQYGR